MTYKILHFAGELLNVLKISANSLPFRIKTFSFLCNSDVEHVLLQLFVVLAQTLNDFALVVEPVCKIRMRFVRLSSITSDILLRKLPHFFSQSLSRSLHGIEFRSCAFDHGIRVLCINFESFER